MDTHITIVPYFTVAEDKMQEFQQNFGHFYQATNQGTLKNGGCLYYGFAIDGTTVFCREGYKDAEGKSLRSDAYQTLDSL